MELFPGFDLPLYLLFLLLMFLLVYIYASWPYNQLEKLGLSGPPPELFFGSLRQFYSKATIYTLKEWNKEHGPLYGVYFGRKPFVVINDLDIIRTVLVKDFAHFTDRCPVNPWDKGASATTSVFFARGGDWKRVRSIMTPTFSAGKMRLMEPQINRCCRDLTKNLLQRAQESEVINVKECFGAYTLDVICSTAFGLQVDSQTDPNDPFLVAVKRATGLEAAKDFKFFNLLLGYLPFLLPVLSRFRTPRHRTFFRETMQSMIQQRKATGSHKCVDFLQLLMNAEDVDNTTGSWKRLTAEEIMGQLMTFFIAGYETTASTLQYLAFNLTKHPDVQQRIVKEMETELGKEEPTYDNMYKLKYLDQTIHETLRMYPPATMITRQASDTVTIKGVTIPQGFGVLIPCSEIMRNPQYYPQPDVFNPDRFSSKADMDNVTFLAFGYGPRTCIGMRLALLEIKMAMVHVLRHVALVRTPDLLDELKFRAGFRGILTVASPILVKVVPHQADQ